MIAAAEVYGGRGFDARHGGQLAWYFEKGLARVYPKAIDCERHGQGLTEFGTAPVYEPPDLDEAARFGAIDRALYRCSDLARVTLALAYGDEGAYWVGRPLGFGDRPWAVAALTEPAREAAEAPQTPEFWRAAFPAYGGAPPGGNRPRAWVRAFVPVSRRNAKARALALRVRRAAELLLDDAEEQFAVAYDVRGAALRQIKREGRRAHEARPFVCVRVEGA